MFLNVRLNAVADFPGVLDAPFGAHLIYLLMDFCGFQSCGTQLWELQYCWFDTLFNFFFFFCSCLYCFCIRLVVPQLPPCIFICLQSLV